MINIQISVMNNFQSNMESHYYTKIKKHREILNVIAPLTNTFVWKLRLGASFSFVRVTKESHDIGRCLLF